MTNYQDVRLRYASRKVPKRGWKKKMVSDEDERGGNEFSLREREKREKEREREGIRRPKKMSKRYI